MGIDYTCLNCKKYNDWNCNRYNNNDLKICDDEFELDESTISQTEGMDISVMGKVYYEVHLTEDDIELVKDWINSRPKYLFSNGINCCTSMAIESLYKDGKL